MATNNSIFNKDSRYVQGGITTVKSNKLDWWEKLPIKQDSTDVVVVISAVYNRRPDIMAKYFYGKSTLMWVILQFNNIVDINEEFIEGKEIRVPTRIRVQLELLNRKTTDADFQ